jgi:hypothetical protein
MSACFVPANRGTWGMTTDGSARVQRAKEMRSFVMTLGTILAPGNEI